jgi:hypothetical protein
MQFTLKSAFILALFASTTTVFASPIDIEARVLETQALRKSRVQISCNDTPFTPDQITSSMNQAKVPENSGFTTQRCTATEREAGNSFR